MKLTDNQQRLYDWLQDGAPHVYFNMDYTVVPATYQRLQPHEILQRNKAGIGECGTVCCIAGAAYLMSKGELCSTKEVEYSPLSLPEEQNIVFSEALKYLSLEPNPDFWADLQHYLFAPDYAPTDCTPQQAAQALLNAIDGAVNPWENVQ